MRTIKITFIPEPREGMRLELATEAMAETVEEAFMAGMQASAMLKAFMLGVNGDTDDDDEDSD